MAYIANMAKEVANRLNEREVRTRFGKWVETHGSQRRAAKKLDVTVGYINDMMSGRRRLSDAALRRIKIKRTTKEVYEAR